MPARERTSKFKFDGFNSNIFSYDYGGFAPQNLVLQNTHIYQVFLRQLMHSIF